MAKTGSAALLTTSRSDQIITVATVMFARDGYRGVGTRAIADEIGISISSLYYHFRSKEDLLFAICLDVTRDFIEQYAHLLDGPEPPRERFARLLDAHIHYFWRHRAQQSVGLRDLRELSTERAEEIQAQKRAYQKRIQAVIEEGVDAGEFSVADPAVSGLAVLDMVNGVQQWFKDDGRRTIDEIAVLYSDLCLRTLGAGDPA